MNVLEAGRALAALAVVLSHADQAFVAFISGGKTTGLSPLLSHGYLGVDFFFVLSGFIIAYASTGAQHLKGARMRFVRSRIIRIYGPYLPVGVGLAMLYVLLPDISASDREWGWFTTVTLLPTNFPPALNVAWTLQHEIVFYAIFALLYFSGHYVLGMICWMVAIVIASFSPLLAAYPALTPIFGLINLEFGLGALAAALYLGNKRVEYSYALPLILVSSATWVLIGAPRELSPIIGFAMAMSLLLLLQIEGGGPLRLLTPLVSLGAASYALYLIHMIVVSAGIRAIVHAGIFQSYGLVILVLTLASVAAAYVYHAAVERPLLSYGRKFTRKIVTRKPGEGLQKPARPHAVSLTDSSEP